MDPLASKRGKRWRLHARALGAGPAVCTVRCSRTAGFGEDCGMYQRLPRGVLTSEPVVPVERYQARGQQTQPAPRGWAGKCEEALCEGRRDRPRFLAVAGVRLGRSTRALDLIGGGGVALHQSTGSDEGLSSSFSAAASYFAAHRGRSFWLKQH